MTRWKRTRALPLWAGFLLGCGEQVAGLLHGHDRTEVVEVSGDVVSRVNGSAIALSEVQRVARATDLAPGVALERLEAERLLGQEAQQRGYAATAKTRQLARQAQVQALLATAVENVDVPEAELEQAYQSQRSRFEQPEKRRATHVLAQLPQDANAADQRAAEAFIVQTIHALETTHDRAATLEAARAETSPAFRVAVQELPAAPEQGAGSFVPEFSRAMFSLAQPGVVPEPVHTQFGYHAIVVTEIVPAVSVPRSAALESLRTELATGLEKQRLQALLDDLRKQASVKFAHDAQEVLAVLDF